MDLSVGTAVMQLGMTIRINIHPYTKLDFKNHG